MSRIEKLGIQLYTVRENFATPEQAAATFRTLKELGYDEAQTASCYGYDFDQFYGFARDAGVEIVGTHEDFQLMKTNLPQSIANHKALHTTNMGIGGFHPKSVAEVEQFIEDANRVAAGIADEGMIFSYHNHSHEFIPMENGKTIMEMLIEGLDPANTSFTLDTFWVQNAGGDVCSWIEKLAGRIDILHLKDMRCDYVEGLNRPIGIITEVGNGNMDFGRIVETALRTGVRHFCVEQDNCPVDFYNSVKSSSDFIHSNFMK